MEELKKQSKEELTVSMFEEVDMNSDFDLEENIVEMNCVLARFNEFEARDITEYDAIMDQLKVINDRLVEEGRADKNPAVESRFNAKKVQL